MQGKAGRSPPGCPPRRLEIIANWSVNLIGSLASIESGNLFACAPAGCSSCTSRRTPRSRGRHANSSQMRGLGVDFAHEIGRHGNDPCGIEKLTSDRSFTAVVLPSLQTG